MKKKKKLHRSFLVVERRRLKNENFQTRTIEKQTQIELKTIISRFRQLIVKLKLFNKDLIQMINDQTKMIHDEKNVTIAKKEKKVILITFKRKRVRSSKFHDV